MIRKTSSPDLDDASANERTFDLHCMYQKFIDEHKIKQSIKNTSLLNTAYLKIFDYHKTNFTFVFDKIDF